ncbi:MAG: ABC transporter permease [Alistipes sp.]|nr:ABC transporter permease [Alistipes sp.]
MLRLLKIEWLKVRRYRAFILLSAVFAVSVVGLNYIVYTQVGRLGDMTTQYGGPEGAGLGGMLIGHPFAYPEVWQSVTYLSSFLLFIPGLIIILLTANEYSFKTHRQAVIDGLSRRQFMAAKIGVVLVTSLFVTVLAVITACIFASAGSAGFTLAGTRYVGYFFVQAVSYMSMALLLVLFFKRSGIAIGVYFLYVFIIKNLLALLLSHKVSEGLGNYLPVKSADLLIPAPTSLGKMFTFNHPDATAMLVASIVWIVLLLWYCTYRFEKSDL